MKIDCRDGLATSASTACAVLGATPRYSAVECSPAAMASAQRGVTHQRRRSAHTLFHPCAQCRAGFALSAVVAAEICNPESPPTHFGMCSRLTDRKMTFGAMALPAKVSELRPPRKAGPGHFLSLERGQPQGSQLATAAPLVGLAANALVRRDHEFADQYNRVGTWLSQQSLMGSYRRPSSRSRLSAAPGRVPIAASDSLGKLQPNFVATHEPGRERRVVARVDRGAGPRLAGVLQGRL
jgi:hypothetical protein